MTAAKRRSSSGASQLGDDSQHHHSTSQQYHTSAESRPASDPDEQQSPPPYSSASNSSHHLGNYSTHNHHAQHNYHGHHHHNQNHYSHHHHQYQQLPQHGHHSDDASDEHLQQQQHQHHLHHQHHHQQQPHNAAMRDCSVKLPLDILWLPKSAMKPAGPDSPHTDCILVVGVSRPKLAAVFLTVMLISLFLTFHVLYDSAVYNIQAAQAVSEQHRLALLSGNRLPDYMHKPAAESSNQISHPMVFPSNRVHFPKTSRRLPQALIIGIRKCGTRALLEMLYLHPRIQKAGGEVHFFDRDENYMKGLEWYRKKMPHSFRGQITIEKSPSYFVSPEVPERVRAMNASIKLLLIVREPVTRAISDYTQLRSHAATASSLPPISPDGANMGAAPSPIGSGLGALYTQQQKSAHSLLYQKLHGAAGLQSLSSAQVYDNSIGGGVGGGVGDEHPPHHGPPGHAADGTTTPSPASAAAAAAAAQMAAKSFEELALFPNGTVNESYRPLTISMYHLHLHRWLEVFPREQLLVVNGDRLIDDPVSQLQRIENFLGIEHRVTSSHFYFNETKGFYCLRYDNGDRCLRETKGRKHPHVDPVVVSKLRKFFAEHNQRFYELVGEDLGWPEE